MREIISSPLCSGIKVTDIVEMGRVTEKINYAVKKYEADFIVMGTHGASGLNEILVGSNTEKVVRDAEVPVLSVKNVSREIKLDKIIFATDFSDERNFVFPFVKSFAESAGAEIHLLKIIMNSTPENREETERQINRLRNENRFNYPAHIFSGEIEEESIRQFAEAQKFEIVALGTHGRHGLVHFFKGSIAEELVNHSSIPVLTINIQKYLSGKTKAEKQRSDFAIKNFPMTDDSHIVK